MDKTMAFPNKDHRNLYLNDVEKVKRPGFKNQT